MKLGWNSIGCIGSGFFPFEQRDFHVKYLCLYLFFLLCQGSRSSINWETVHAITYEMIMNTWNYMCDHLK